MQLDDDVLDALDLEYVVAFAPLERVASGAAVQRVVPGATSQAVGARIATIRLAEALPVPSRFAAPNSSRVSMKGLSRKLAEDCTVSSPAFGASKTMSAVLSTR